MRLFGRHEQRAKMSTYGAASLLAETINSKVPPEMLSELEPDDVDAIVRLLRWTRASIVIRWLRTLEKHTNGKTTWTEVLIHVEKQILPADPVKGVGCAALVNKLLPLLAEHQRLSIDKNLPETDRFSRVRIWAQNWIALICDDKAYAEQLGYLFGFQLYAFTADEVIRFTNLFNELSANLSGKA